MSTNKDKSDEKKLPGYPHYPAKDDLTQPNNNNGRVENKQPRREPTDNLEEDPDTNIVMGTDADVTDEDLRMLDRADQGMAYGDDKNLIDASLDDEDEDGDALNEEGFGEELSGADMDVPGSEADDADELLGEEDEENNYYSLGGDREDDRENEDNY